MKARMMCLALLVTTTWKVGAEAAEDFSFPAGEAAALAASESSQSAPLGIDAIRPEIRLLLRLHPDLLVIKKFRKLRAGCRTDFEIVAEWTATHSSDPRDHWEEFNAKYPHWSNEVPFWLDDNKKRAQLALSVVKPHTRLRGSVPVSQIMRYLNAEMAARHLPFRVRIPVYIGSNGDTAEEISRMLDYTPLKPKFEDAPSGWVLTPDDSAILNQRVEALSTALRKGSLYDIADALAESMRSVGGGSLKVFGSGYILVGLGGLEE